MHYMKYFSGSVDATTTTNQYYMGLDKKATSTSLRTGYIKNRSDVIGNAIVSTLRDVGYSNAYWDSTSGYLFFDKSNSLSGIYLAVQNNYLCIGHGYVTSSSVRVDTFTSSGESYFALSQGSSSYSPFKNTGAVASDYKFYVTIMGEPKGAMMISIGVYDNPSKESAIYFYVFKGKDKRDNSATIGFNFALTTSPFKFAVTKYSDAKYIATTAQISSTQRLTLDSEQKIVLIPVFCLYGYVFLDNTYFNPGISTTGFYKIGNDTYYVSDYWITKCVTTV